MSQIKGLAWKNADLDKQREQLEALYMEAFPKEERKPFSLIIEKQQEGYTEVLSLEDAEGNFCGMAITILYKDIVLLDYFAISAKARGGGIGTEALRMLQERAVGKRFILEIEATDILAKNLQQRIRRKAFYLRNGMHSMGYLVELVGVEMEVLAHDCSLSYEEYQAIYETVYPDRKLVRKIG